MHDEQAEPPAPVRCRACPPFGCSDGCSLRTPTVPTPSTVVVVPVVMGRPARGMSGSAYRRVLPVLLIIGLSLFGMARAQLRWNPGSAHAHVSAAVTCQGAAYTPGGADPWGGCFPGAWNTGIPTGTSLTTYSGSCLITTNNTVITGKDASACQPLEIRASNVQITNSKVEQIWLDTDMAGASAWSVSITDSDITSSRVFNQAMVCCGDYTLTRVEITGGDYSTQCEMGTANGVNGVNCTTRDSWLHGQIVGTTGSWHAGGFISEGGPNVILTDHNYIICDVPTDTAAGSDIGCTGDYNLLGWFGTLQDATVQKNMFGTTATDRNGGPATADYCVYGGVVATPGGSPATQRVKFLTNVFARGPSNKCGNVDAATNYSSTDPGNVWSGNVYTDGVTVPAPS